LDHVGVYEVPMALAAGLAREMASRQESASSSGADEGEVEPIAATLAGYVSASLLERSGGVF